MNRIKVLAIGNSFSINAMTYLDRIAAADGVWMTTGDLYIGGCPLGRHVNNIRKDARDYGFHLNTKLVVRGMSVREGLLSESWDYVTMQQASGYSGVWESYTPYMKELSDYVTHFAPQAQQLIHETWAYEKDAPHRHFEFYHRSQAEMYKRLRECYQGFASTVGARIIPAGDVIQRLRETRPFFNYGNGGISLNKDGFHLTPYGCYAAGATWYGFITGNDIRKNSFVPQGCDPGVIAEIRETVYEVLNP